jgi:hypothetical protein
LENDPKQGRLSVKTNLFFPVVLLGSLASASPASAGTVFFSTGDPDGLMAAASRPSSAGSFEIETADDFVLTRHTAIDSATFTGLLTGGSSTSDVGSVAVEIYRIFPLDSNVGRTIPPTFSTAQVPTRVNSPSDVAFDSRTSPSGLTFSTATLAGTFTAANSVEPGGIHAVPNQKTQGNGALTGQEVEFDVTFTTPMDLPAGHYFFVPQVEVSGGNFEWLSAPKPIAPPGTPFPAGATDLQGWTRDDALAPDWLRVGKDIVDGTPAPAFNFAFSVSGNALPEPSTWAMMILGFFGIGFMAHRRRSNGARPHGHAHRF